MQTILIKSKRSIKQLNKAMKRRNLVTLSYKSIDKTVLFSNIMEFHLIKINKLFGNLKMKVIIKKSV